MHINGNAARNKPQSLTGRIPSDPNVQQFPRPDTPLRAAFREMARTDPVMVREAFARAFQTPKPPTR